jgi:hypothetical protein
VETEREERVSRGGSVAGEGVEGVEHKKGLHWEEAGGDVEGLHWVERCSGTGEEGLHWRSGAAAVGRGEWHNAVY